MSNSQPGPQKTKEEFLQELEDFIKIVVVETDHFHTSLGRLYTMLYSSGSLQNKLKNLIKNDKDLFILKSIEKLKKDYGQGFFMNQSLTKPFKEILKKQVRKIQDLASIYIYVCSIGPEFENTEFAEPIYNLLNYDEQESIVNRETRREKYSYTLKFFHSQEEEKLKDYQNDLKHFYRFVMELHYIHEHRIALNYSKWNYRSLTILDMDLLPKLSVQELQIPSISHNQNQDELYFTGDKEVLLQMHDILQEIQRSPSEKRFLGQIPVPLTKRFLYFGSTLKEADLYNNYKEELLQRFLHQVISFDYKFKHQIIKETHLTPA
jgi:hypothetical protein